MRVFDVVIKIAIPGNRNNDDEFKMIIDSLVEVNEWYEGPLALQHKVVNKQTLEDPCDPGISITPWSLEQPPEEEIDWVQADVWRQKANSILKQLLENEHVDRLADEYQNGIDHGAVK